MATPRRRVLFIAQIAPPSPLVAARRVAGLTKYLARLGLEVTVLTSRISGGGEIEGAARVVRTSDLMASRINWRRGHFEALSSGSGSGTYQAPSRLQSYLVPDVASTTWLPFAAGRALSLSRSHAFDCVLSSSPAQAAHLAGLSLKKARHLPWIAEFRDGWTFDRPPGVWPWRWQQRFDGSLERAVATDADLLVAVTEPIAADLRARFSVACEVITNGFDPEDQATDGDVSGLLDDRLHSLVYTGRLAHSGRTLGPLLEGVRRLRASAPDAASALEIVFAGPLSEEESRELSAPDLGGMVRSVGYLDRDRALAFQRCADSLLVLAQGSSGPSVATAKLFEYLAARKPILVLGNGSEAARIVTATGSGFTTSASDAGAIAAALRRLPDMPPLESSGDAIQDYAYPRIAERMAEAIESVCA